MSTDDQRPAASRGTPAPEPTIEVDAQAHVPPEAAVVALTPGGGTAAPAAADVGYEALAAAEEAGERADPSPAEVRVAPTVEPTVELDEGAYVPPAAAVVLEHRDAPS
jgi:hypothetical protein